MDRTTRRRIGWNRQQTWRRRSETLLQWYYRIRARDDLQPFQKRLLLGRIRSALCVVRDPAIEELNLESPAP